MAPTPVPMEDRFWAKVDKRGLTVPGMKSRCWIWTAAMVNNGYGTIGMPGRSGRMVMAHRYSWELHNGPIPDGVLVLHRCDNRGCVRPSHLFLGSHKDNMQDKVAKGRHYESKKTHCPRDHEYTPENTYRYGNKRECRACKKLRSRKVPA